MSRSGPGSVKSVHYASSPLLASRTPPWRSRFVVALVGIAFAGLLVRAVHVQVVRQDFYQAQGEKRYLHREPLAAHRGRILDRHGAVLATSVALPSVQVEPKTFAADAQQRKALARLVELPLAELNERVASNAPAVVLRRHLDEAAWLQIKALGLKGVHEVREYKRRFPEGEAAAHLVGFTNGDGKGIEGIELRFDDQLAGRKGQRAVVRDRLGRVVEDLDEPTPPEHGRDVQLSIDSKVQFFAYQRIRDAVAEHQARAGAVVVLDVKTGEVLALANAPSFDPARRQNLREEQRRNLALTQIFEPGSTMKPFTAALAIENGRATPATMIQTAPGRLTITGSTISDAHPHGLLSVAEVIQKSSNVGTVKLAMELSSAEMWGLFTQIGLGQRPPVELPGAATGRLRPAKSWRPIEKATMSYGYGLSASLFQLARAYTVFARDGELAPVSILRQDGPAPGQRVFSPATAQAVRKMLQAAAGPGGTAPKAQTDGYSVGGKTGTARKQDERTKAYTTRYRAWFVGFAPVSDPRIVVAVMVDEPNKGLFYGGDVAAPVFSQVVQQSLRLLGVAPDIEVKPAIVHQQPAEVESF